MDGHGCLTIRTRRARHEIEIEFEDEGAGHSRGDRGADLGPVLHHQAAGAGDRPGPRHCPGHRGRSRRTHRDAHRMWGRGVSFAWCCRHEPLDPCPGGRRREEPARPGRPRAVPARATKPRAWATVRPRWPAARESLRRGRARHEDAQEGGHRGAARAAGVPRAPASDRHDRVPGSVHRRRGDEARRLRLPHQADQDRGAGDPRAQGGREGPAPARQPRPAGSRPGGRTVRRDRDPQPADARGPAHRGAGGADRRPPCSCSARAAPARSWWPVPSTSARGAPSGPSCRSTAAPCRARCSSPSCSVTRRARSPARSAPSPGSSSWPTAARSSSTRSARWSRTAR